SKKCCWREIRSARDALSITMSRDRWSRRSGRGTLMPGLGKHFHKSGAQAKRCFIVECTKSLQETPAVHRPKLVESDLAGAAFKMTGDSRGKSMWLRRQRSNDHSMDRAVHELRRDHRAWSRFVHLSADRRIQSNQIDAKSLNTFLTHQVHSFS